MTFQVFQNPEAITLIDRYKHLAIDQQNPPPDTGKNRVVSLSNLEKEAGHISQEVKKLLGN